MAEQELRFDDGASYERLMGVWSRLAGTIFLDWLKPQPGLRWIDVGCGNGAFTALVCESVAPAEVHGIDPSEAQLAFARTRAATRTAVFEQGNAMVLPFPEARFHVAVMALVIQFVSDPAKAVSEMARVVASGGAVAAYNWNIGSGGSPLSPIQAGLRTMGYRPATSPSNDASGLAALQQLWAGAGLEKVETREISVTRTFADFNDFWTASAGGPTTAPVIAAMEATAVDDLKDRVRAALTVDASGRITCTALANAVKGHVPR